MSGSLLQAQNLSVRFGGLLAVNQVSFEVKPGEVFTLIGPNGAGKTTVFNLISGIYTPTSGSIEFQGPHGPLDLTRQPAHQMASLGIARTFQNIELFEHASVGTERDDARILIELIEGRLTVAVVLNIPGGHQNAGLGYRIGHLIEVVIDVVNDYQNLRLLGHG
jgi:ABC-type branched-subunit amino acid transport system ATPase component